MTVPCYCVVILSQSSRLACCPAGLSRPRSIGGTCSSLGAHSLVECQECQECLGTRFEHAFPNFFDPSSSVPISPSLSDVTIAQFMWFGVQPAPRRRVSPSRSPDAVLPKSCYTIVIAAYPHCRIRGPAKFSLYRSSWKSQRPKDPQGSRENTKQGLTGPLNHDSGFVCLRVFFSPKRIPSLPLDNAV
ncbi:hypothetical protein GQ53DRAFT_746343, partial [Thozetella sp. PMI_491]